MLDYKEAAELLRVKIGTLYAMVSENRIPHVRLGPRLVRFERERLLAWIAAARVDATEGRR